MRPIGMQNSPPVSMPSACGRAPYPPAIGSMMMLRNGAGCSPRSSRPAMIAVSQVPQQVAWTFLPSSSDRSSIWDRHSATRLPVSTATGNSILLPRAPGCAGVADEAPRYEQHREKEPDETPLDVGHID